MDINIHNITDITVGSESLENSGAIKLVVTTENWDKSTRTEDFNLFFGRVLDRGIKPEMLIKRAALIEALGGSVG